MLADSQGAVDTVFVETIAPVSTTEIGAVGTINFMVPLLSKWSAARVYRVVIYHRSDNFILINPLEPIERHTELNGCREALKHVHVVGHRHASQLFFGNMVIPTCPSGSFSR